MGTSLSHVYFVQSPCNSGTIPTESIRYSNRYFPTTLYSPLIGKGEGVVGSKVFPNESILFSFPLQFCSSRLFIVQGIFFFVISFVPICRWKGEFSFFPVKEIFRLLIIFYNDPPLTTAMQGLPHSLFVVSSPEPNRGREFGPQLRVREGSYARLTVVGELYGRPDLIYVSFDEGFTLHWQGSESFPQQPHPAWEYIVYLIFSIYSYFRLMVFIEI